LIVVLRHKGTNLNISHLAATPFGMKVKAESTIEKVDGRKILFKVVAFDEREKIGEGTHERFILNKDRFQKKANEKKST
jgi:fluoroacetyl-CoA thioesterase